MPAADERDGRGHLRDRAGVVAAQPVVGVTAGVLERVAQPHHLAAGHADVELVQPRVRQRLAQRAQAAVDRDRRQPALLEGDEHQPRATVSSDTEPPA